MRQSILSLIHLLILIFYLIRPAMPYIEYILNKKYIEKYLCVERDNPENTCQGKCHLQSELEKTVKNTDEGTNNNKKQLTDRRAEDHLMTEMFKPVNYPTLIKMTNHNLVINRRLWPEKIFVPPKPTRPV